MWTSCKEYEVSTFYASTLSYQTKQTDYASTLSYQTKQIEGVPKLMVKSTFVSCYIKHGISNFKKIILFHGLRYYHNMMQILFSF